MFLSRSAADSSCHCICGSDYFSVLCAIVVIILLLSHPYFSLVLFPFTLSFNYYEPSLLEYFGSQAIPCCYEEVVSYDPACLLSPYLRKGASTGADNTTTDLEQGSFITTYYFDLLCILL